MQRASTLLFLALAACTGKSGSVGDPTPGGTAPTTTTTSLPPGRPTSTPPSPGKPADMLTSNPGKVSCGSIECELPDLECCGLGTPPTCSKSCGSHARSCDETADCPGSQVCCHFAGSSGGPQAECSEKECSELPFEQSPEGSGQRSTRICKKDGDCPPTQVCLASQTANGIAFGRCQVLGP